MLVMVGEEWGLGDNVLGVVLEEAPQQAEALGCKQMVDVFKRNGQWALVESIHMLHGVCRHVLSAVRVHGLWVTIFSLNLAKGRNGSDAAGNKRNAE